MSLLGGLSPPGWDDPAPAGDPLDARQAAEATGILRSFNRASVLVAADVHVALRLAALGGGAGEATLLATALAVRAVRLGSVCVDLDTVVDSTVVDSTVVDSTVVDSTVVGSTVVGTDDLPWPDRRGWVQEVAAHPTLVATEGDAPEAARPLRLEGTRLYLDRYWRLERRVAADLQARAADPVAVLDAGRLRAGLDRLFPADPADAGVDPADAGVDLARLAAAAAVAARLSVVAGGPGTGKTTAVARILALLDEQEAAGGRRRPRVALAAPTGKAASRLAQAVHAEAARMDVDDEVRGRLLATGATTVHRLLGWRPGGSQRFAHDRTRRLPHDVVVIDETSMLSLALMGSLLDAVRPDARVVLVGDPRQLASVEAGAVLGDVVGPAVAGPVMSASARRRLAALTGADVPAADPPGGVAVGDGIVVLRRVHRYGGGIADLAAAVVSGDGPAVAAVLRRGSPDLRWDGGEDLSAVRRQVTASGRAVVEAARQGRPGAALAALAAVRVLCVHRLGPTGVAAWNEQIERWLAPALAADSGDRWHPGRPLLVTENDYEHRLFNGDTGVVVRRADGERVAVFEDQGALREVPTSRLGAVETLHAMTVHKAQGSQFDEVVVVLPDVDGPLLTRELLYTAITRARRQVTVVGSEAVLLAGVARRVTRASGLGERLWGAAPPPPTVESPRP